ncbi:MAG: DNA repair protein RecN [Acidimicrobiales bacterium]
MLAELRVRGLGVIDDLTVRFGPGMTAVTGETGTGKTLLVEALHVVLGGRASPVLVRKGVDEAVVEARFVTETALGGTGAEVVLARSVPASGRSRAWRDGHMVPLASLADTGADLVDIHGQHDHQSLLSAAAQRRILDEYCGADLAPRRLAQRAVRDLEQTLESLGGTTAERSREADMLRHQLREIDGASISDPDEEASLKDERDRLADLTEHRAAVASVLAALDGDAGSGAGGAEAGVLTVLAHSAEAMSTRPALSGWGKRLRAAAADLGDLASELRHAADSWEDDPVRLDEVHHRLQVLADLRRKYGTTLSEVVAFADRARRRLGELEDGEVVAAQLVERRKAALDALGEAEAELGACRRAAAPRLAAAVQERLRRLAMPQARFSVVVGGGTGAADPADGDSRRLDGPDRAGDGVRFLLGANPGEPAQDLLRVASGGELSRTMLAIRLVASGGPDTMVFDEVDAGVGGEAARSLAGALREVARDRQVLVVTHLAQVAAAADRQITVGKVVTGGRTVAAVHELNADERVVELSRMLSGHPNSVTARAHAEELLAAASGPDPSTMPTGHVD